MRPLRLAIVGAGPAGLTAALCARRLGIEVALFEQSLDPARLGGGVVLQSNGLRVIEALGLSDRFAPLLETTHVFTLEEPDGRVLSRFDYRALAIPQNRFGVIMRSELQSELLDAVSNEGGHVELGRRSTGVRLEPGAATLEIDGGAAFSADAVIAADGIHSTLRSSLGLVAHLQPMGEASLRGVVETAHTPDRAREIWASDGRIFGIAPLPRRRAYFYCTAPLGRWQATLESGIDSWIRSWSDLGPDVMEVLRAVPDWRRTTYDELKDVRVDRWFHDRVFVVGDAAHAMTPHLGQGANSAMVDAVVLVRMLAEAGTRDVASVGPRYQALRRDFVQKIQRASLQVGRLSLWRSPTGRWLRRAAMAAGSRFPPVARRNRLLAAGFHPAEERFLASGNPPSG